MGLKINGSTSGSIEIDVPAVAGTDTSITIPAKNGGTFIVEESTGNIDLGPLDINGSASDDSVNIDANGKLLVGTSTAATTGNAQYSRFQIQGDTDFDRATMALRCALSAGSITTNVAIGEILFTETTGGTFASIYCAADGTAGSGDYPASLRFQITEDAASSPTERMRITKNGEQRHFGTLATNINIANTASAGNTYEFLYCQHSSTGLANGTNSFKVTTNGNVSNTNNSYGSLSDQRLKENIVDATSQWNDIKGLQVRKYNFREATGHETYTQIGLIAQEVESVSPGLVQTDPVKEGETVLDADGNQLQSIKSINYSVLYMKSVKALQEAMTRIETLEAANASLEARLTALEGGAS